MVTIQGWQDHSLLYARQKCNIIDYWSYRALSLTNVTLCGCSSSVSPAFVFPPDSTPKECLSTGPATPLSKRTLTFSQNLDGLRFTCYKDRQGNPFQDCLNSMNYICRPGYIASDPATRIPFCRNAVDNITNSLNEHWQKVRRACGQWSWKEFKGNFSSPECQTANSNLRDQAYYVLPDNTWSYVTVQLTESVRLGLWNNAVLEEKS